MPNPFVVASPEYSPCQMHAKATTKGDEGPENMAIGDPYHEHPAGAPGVTIGERGIDSAEAVNGLVVVDILQKVK